MTNIKGVKKSSGELHKYNTARINLYTVEQKIKEGLERILSDFDYEDIYNIYFGDEGIYINFTANSDDRDSYMSTRLLSILDNYFGVCGQVYVEGSHLALYYNLSSFPTTQSVFDI